MCLSSQYTGALICPPCYLLTLNSSAVCLRKFDSTCARFSNVISVRSKFGKGVIRHTLVYFLSSASGALTHKPTYVNLEAQASDQSFDVSWNVARSNVLF